MLKKITTKFDTFNFKVFDEYLESEHIIEEISNLPTDDLRTLIISYCKHASTKEKDYVQFLFANFYYALGKNREKFGKWTVDEGCCLLWEGLASGVKTTHPETGLKYLFDLFSKDLRQIWLSYNFLTKKTLSTDYTIEFNQMMRTINFRMELKKDKKEFLKFLSTGFREVLGKRLENFEKYFEKEEWCANWIILDLKGFTMLVELLHSNSRKIYIEETLETQETCDKQEDLSIEDARDAFMFILTRLFENHLKDITSLDTVPYLFLDNTLREQGFGL